MSAIAEGFLALVPTRLMLPCERTDAAMSVPLAVDADPVRVYAPELDAYKGALAVGSVELIRSYCEVWTRFLSLAGSGVRSTP